jgi:hypothetical protein
LLSDIFATNISIFITWHQNLSPKKFILDILLGMYVTNYQQVTKNEGSICFFLEFFYLCKNANAIKL